jgi:hypothetical protein
MTSWVLALSFLAAPSGAGFHFAFAGTPSIAPRPAASGRGSASLLNLDLVARAAGEPTAFAQPAPRASSRDSLGNGVMTGAIIGAVALGTFAGILCKALQEPDGPSCVPDTLRIAAVGAAIGAAGGLAIDAALSTTKGVRVAIRIRF